MIRFTPLLKQTLWGGDKISQFKRIANAPENVGETWELSGVRGSETKVRGGEYDGLPLNALVARLRGKLVGEDNYARFGDEFPLLIKFIDAHQDLSIQVHPSDEQAVRQGKERGKTEMWYVMESAPEAKLRCGLKHEITPEEYKAMVANDTICDAICEYGVSEGDCFFIPAGRIHSIGAGCFLAEIQQTSDVTYRIYDFKRKDKHGNYRELHTALAAESIDYDVQPDYRTPYTPAKDEGVQLVSCPYFSTAVYDLTEPMALDYSELDSFVVLICLRGEGAIIDEEGRQESLQAGDTLLLPAWVNTVRLEGNLKFLETYV